MPWVKSEATFRDFLSLVIVHAPDEFPVEDFLPPEEQLTLERAFKELHAGVEFLPAKRVSSSEKQALHALLERAHSTYAEGKAVEGSRLLHELESKAFSLGGAGAA